MISFVIRRSGVVLDGTPLGHAIELIDAQAARPSIGFSVNCVHARVLETALEAVAATHSESCKRLLTFQANTADKEVEELDGSAENCIPSLPRCLQMASRDCAIALVCAFSAVVVERTAGTSTPSPVGCAARSPRAEGKAGAADKRKPRPSINRLPLPLVNEGPLIDRSPRSVVRRVSPPLG